jgi:SAM-dependent methyltransferase
MNLEAHGTFDAVFCCGLLYHLDRPRELLNTIGRITRRAVILNTHFSRADEEKRRFFRRPQPVTRFNLSPIEQNEGLRGRWYPEFASDEAMRNREAAKWSSWHNRSSFWILHEDLIHAISTAGFDMVFEQFDHLDLPLNTNLSSGYYKTDSRGVFVGLKG